MKGGIRELVDEVDARFYIPKALVVDDNIQDLARHAKHFEAQVSKSHGSEPTMRKAARRSSILFGLGLAIAQAATLLPTAFAQETSGGTKA